MKNVPPQIIADVFLYATADGGRRLAAPPGWGCPCSCSNSKEEPFYDARLLLDAPLAPGERRRVGFVFLSGMEAASVFRSARKFYLWEGRFVGEATVVSDAHY